MKKTLVATLMAIAALHVHADPRVDGMTAILSAKLFTCQLQLKNEGGIGLTSCAATKEAEFTNFKENFGNARASENAKVKAMFAQWMTAMDAAGTRFEEAEELKFNTLSNELKLE